jgi:integrase/recombinase XerD
MSEHFVSQWAGELGGFLSFKRSLGYGYHRAGFTLRALDHSLVAQGATRSHRQLDAAVLRWLVGRPGRKLISMADELCVVREFYRFLRRSGRRIAPDPPWPRVSWSSDFVPYILSLDEVRTLIRLTGKLRGAFRRTTYRTLLLVLYCTGLRFGEALRLRLRDVDLPRATFFITASKGRSRWVPFHRSLCRHLGQYLTARKAFAPAGPDDRLFVGANRTRLPVSTAGGTICRLVRLAGLKPPSGRSGPRPYDLRHAFAVHRLTRWYRAGVDLQARLPWLSAFMGHDDLLGTEVYLNATPELLQLAGNRFRQCFARARQR